jgi:hypothetical protein
MMPKFLLGDNTDFPDDIFIIHTEYPRFVYNIDTEELEWFDDIEDSEADEATDEVARLLEAAEAFYQREVDRYEDLDESGEG